MVSLRRHVPRVLPKEEQPSLAQAGIKPGSGVLLHEERRNSQQVRGDRGPGGRVAVRYGVHCRSCRLPNR